MADRVRIPSQALDYPKLPDSTFIVWCGNEYKWPDGRRSTSFLTSSKRDAMKGYALFTQEWEGAETFSTEEAARAWLAEEEAKRAHPYGVNVTTVAEMKRARGYA